MTNENKHQQYGNLINEIKRLMNHEYGLWDISLSNKKDDMRCDKTLPDSVRLSSDKTNIIVRLYAEDTLDEMADKLIKAEELMDEALKFKRYKQNSPYLIEALQHNIPELSKNCLY